MLCCAGSLTGLESAQESLVNLGLSFSQAPLVQLASGRTINPGETLQTAVQDALQCEVSQLAFVEKVH